jgi:hypothetical protein
MPIKEANAIKRLDEFHAFVSSNLSILVNDPDAIWQFGLDAPESSFVYKDAGIPPSIILV